MRYHVCLVCGGTGYQGDKSCFACQKKWKSKRLEYIHDILKMAQSDKAIPLDKNSSEYFLFAGFDNGYRLEEKNMPIGIFFDKVKVFKGKIIDG